jgi:nucleoid DNA-binding protein
MPELILDQSLLKQQMTAEKLDSELTLRHPSQLRKKKRAHEAFNTLSEVANTLFLSTFSVALRVLNSVELRKNTPEKYLNLETTDKEKVKIEKNPYFKPYEQAVIQGIEEFQKKTLIFPCFGKKYRVFVY